MKKKIHRKRNGDISFPTKSEIKKLLNVKSDKMLDTAEIEMPDRHEIEEFLNIKNRDIKNKNNR